MMLNSIYLTSVAGLSQSTRKSMGLALTAAALWHINMTGTFAQSLPTTITVNPKISTSPVKDNADDPAIWIHPTDPAKSVIIGTDKQDSTGGLYVWDMSGRQVQYVQLDHPNNVDVHYGMKLGGTLVDIAVTNPRNLKQMKVYKISPIEGALTDITTNSGIQTPELRDPYGICLYRRPADGAMFVIQSTDSGAKHNLHQYRLEDDGTGKVKATYLRAFGNNTIEDVVEGLVADDELGYLYAADEDKAVRKYYADRDRGDDNQIAAFAMEDSIVGDREGLALYKCANRTGYLLLSSQGNTTVKVYRREGDPGNPHQHTLVTTIKTNGSSKTDGIEVTNRPTSTIFPQGFLVTHDSPGDRFNLYAWEDIAQNYLTICPNDSATSVMLRGDNRQPTEFKLEQNYPNPFSRATQIRSTRYPATAVPFELTKSAPIKLTIVNLIGQTTRTLVNGSMAAGKHIATWDGHDDAGKIVPSGIYWVRLESGVQVQIKKLAVVN